MKLPYKQREAVYDGSREKDLEQLKQLLDDPKVGLLRKRQVYRSFTMIKRTMRDPFIKHNRLKLIKATQANDVEETKRLSELLAAYEQRHYGRNG